MLESPSGILEEAYLRDAQDGDSGIIYVKNQKETVTTEGDCTVTELAGGGKKYSFSGGSGSGYSKSTCSTSGIPDCGSGSAKFEITPNGANSIKVVAYKSGGGPASTQYWSGYASSATIDYIVSTPPSGGSDGSVTVMPSTYYGKTLVQTVIKKETTEKWLYIPSEKTESDPVTVLAQSGSTAVQNFAFDGMEDAYD